MATKRTKTQTKKTPAKSTGGTARKQAARTAVPAVQETMPPVARDVQPPVVKEEAQAPAVREEAQAPVVKEESLAPAVSKETQALDVVEAAPEAPAEPAAEAAPEAPAESAAETAPETPAEPAAETAPEAPAEPAAETAPEAPMSSSVAAKILLKPNKDGSKITPVVPRPITPGNPYRPMEATVLEVITETHNIKTIRVTLDDPEVRANFHYEPGQVGQLSVFGTGESTFVINSPPSMKDYLQFSVMMAGEVTTVIHNLTKGDKVGVRAPLGRPFPYELWKGRNIYFIGGGIGMAPIRTIMLHCLEHKEDYGRISLLYGGRSPQDLAYSYELDDWINRPDLDCTLTIDREAEGWQHKVGMIPNVLRELAPSPDNTIAVLCGPPIMIKFTLMALDELGFPHENVYTTLEKRMKCGIGICGRCGIGGKYVCLDGPVFSQKELDELPPEL